MLNCCCRTQTVLLTKIKSEDVYEEFFKHKHLFDLSNFPKYSKFFDPVNEKVIGKMKDVSEGKMNDEFVELKSKMYSVKNIDGKEFNTAKGVNIATESNKFKDTLFNKKLVREKTMTSNKCCGMFVLCIGPNKYTKASLPGRKMSLFSSIIIATVSSYVIITICTILHIFFQVSETEGLAELH